MERTYCDRCGREIPVQESRNIILGVHHNQAKDDYSIDLCPGCAEAFRTFVANGDVKSPMPEGAPEGAVAGSYDIRALAEMFRVSIQTMRRWCDRAEVDSFMSVAANGRGIRCWKLDEGAWERLAHLAAAHRALAGMAHVHTVAGNGRHGHALVAARRKGAAK